MQEENPVELLLEGLKRLLDNFKDREIPKNGQGLPPDIDKQLAQLKQMIDVFSTTAIDAIKDAGIEKDTIATSIAHPELLSPENKRILNKAKQIKNEVEELYKLNNKKLQQGKDAKKPKKDKENVSSSERRIKKFKSLGGTKWKPV
jgi:hypothetical protein